MRNYKTDIPMHAPECTPVYTHSPSYVSISHFIVSIIKHVESEINKKNIQSILNSSK